LKSWQRYEMHEFSVAESLLVIIEQEAASYGTAPVVGVKLRIGKLSGIVPDALRFAFSVLSEGRRTEGAALLIEEVPIQITCRACGRVSTVDDPFLLCPHCSGSEVELTGGRELEITEMEIADGNQSCQEHP
jgi:hydrogenase nickel incorporation protein HypA/HybF